jgi:hypothetical protein
MLEGISADYGINSAQALGNWTRTGELGDTITSNNFNELYQSV